MECQDVPSWCRMIPSSPAAKISVGPLPQALFVGFLSVAHAVGLWGLFAFFATDIGSSLLTLRELLPHALANSIAAPFVTQGVGALLDRLGDDEGSQRPLRLEPRTLSL